MFIDSININNFKCFGGDFEPLIFSKPDGKTIGTGLNIFIGENNCGKSTIFESIDFLRDNTKKNISDIKNKKSGDDDFFVEICFSGSVSEIIENFSQENKKNVFKKYIYQNNGNEYFKLLRSSKDIKAIQLWNDKEAKFKNESGIDAPLKKLFDANFIWSDTNPNEQAAFGATTICGNLLKEIVRRFEETNDYKDFSKEFHKTFNNADSGLRKELKNIEQKTQKIFSEQFSDAQISFHFDELKIDNFFKNTKVEVEENGGFATYMEEKGTGMQRSIALALLQVYTAELAQHPENKAIEKPSFLFIDEPEICLHPQAQLRLFNAILELSKTKQIFITTHSPYFFKNNFLKNAGLYIFKKEVNSEVRVEKINNNWGLFQWSPSWGEINFFAYNLPTIEFHDELYGFLHQNFISNAINQDDVKKRSYQTEFEKNFLQKQNLIPSKSWMPEIHGIIGAAEAVTLQTFIRNKVHHPENVSMRKDNFNNVELKQSIDEMINIARQIITKP